MGKISFDKYYTPPTVARWCIDKVKDITMSSIDYKVINRLIRICIPEINTKYPIKDIK